MQICRVPPRSPRITPAWLSEVRQLTLLIGPSRQQARPYLRQALSLLASLLGQMPQHQVVSRPFGYAGPQLRSAGWIDRAALEQIGKQLVGLIWDGASPESVRLAVEAAVSEALSVGFLQDKAYDAWRPGMPSGSGWRTAVSVTPYGLVKARALLGPLGNAMSAEGRPPIAELGATAVSPQSSRNGQPGAAIRPADSGAPVIAGPTTTPPDIKPAPVTSAQTPASAPQAAAPASEDPYEWARQVDLVRATNQVLGEDFLHKGVLSRECAKGHLVTNGKSGRAARVSCDSFLTWLGRKHGVGVEELTQLRNAIIGEIRARNL